jgi:hypothetical protein
MIKERFQTASQNALPPAQEELWVDPLVKANTRFNPGPTRSFAIGATRSITARLSA